jgi:hypothetical protein
VRIICHQLRITRFTFPVECLAVDWRGDLATWDLKKLFRIAQ